MPSLRQLLGNFPIINPFPPSGLVVSTGAGWGFSTSTVNIINNVASTSSTTGALVVAGGVGIGGDLYVSGTIFGNNDASEDLAITMAIALG